MKLWTLQNKFVQDYLAEELVYTASYPKNIPTVMTGWFNNKTKFNNWPVWCSLCPPDIDDIRERIKNSHNKNKILLELKVPNNEKMIFINEEKWKDLKNEYLKNNYISKDKENEINQIFNIYDIRENKKNHISVCINSLNKNWVENFYKLDI